MRRPSLHTLLAWCCLLAATTQVWCQTDTFKRGDSNVDSEVNISDASHILGYLFLGNPKTLDCEDAADSNDDGQLDISDASNTLGFLFLGRPRFLPPPGAFVSGSDPTADDLGCGDALDSDGDGLSDEAELASCTDPFNRDTDEDGIHDGAEQSLCTDPCNSDTDGDGLDDKLEFLILCTDPCNADTDGDGIPDGLETHSSCSSPCTADTDGDGLSDATETPGCTSPCDPDSDGDGLIDGQESGQGRDPCIYDPPPVTITTRNDDGSRESETSTDLCDDWIQKRLQVPAGSKIAAARLFIYGQAYGNLNATQAGRLLVNHSFPDVMLDVCIGNAQAREIRFRHQDLFSSGSYTWASVDIPTDWILSGENTFMITEGPGGAFQDNNLRVGIDTDKDEDRSAWLQNINSNNPSFNPASNNGELMIYLEIDVIPPPLTPNAIDLMHTNDFVKVEPSQVVAELPVTFRATISHSGLRDVDNIEVAFRLRLDSGSTQEVVVQHPVLPSDQPQIFAATVTAPSESFDLDVVIDPNSRQVESDRSNNTVTRRVEVSPRPRDVSLRILSADASLGRVDFTAEIRNSGLADVKFVRWLVQVKDGVTGNLAWTHGGGFPVTPFEPSSLSAGETRTITRTLEYEPHTSGVAEIGGIDSGTYFLSAQIYAEANEVVFGPAQPLDELDCDWSEALGKDNCANNRHAVYYEAAQVGPYPETGNLEVVGIDYSPGTAGILAAGYIWVRLRNEDESASGRVTVRLSFTPSNDSEAEAVSLGEKEIIVHSRDPGSRTARFDSRRFPYTDSVYLLAEVLTGDEIITTGRATMPIEYADIAIGEIRVEEPYPTTDLPIHFQVPVFNYGTETVEAELRLLVDGVFFDNRVLSLLPRSGASPTVTSFIWEACPEGSSDLCPREEAREYSFTFEIPTLPDYAAQNSVSANKRVEVSRPADLYLGRLIVPEYVEIGHAATITISVRDLAVSNIPYPITTHQVFGDEELLLDFSMGNGGSFIEQFQINTNVLSEFGEYEIVVRLNGMEYGRMPIHVVRVDRVIVLVHGIQDGRPNGPSVYDHFKKDILGLDSDGNLDPDETLLPGFENTALIEMNWGSHGFSALLDPSGSLRTPASILGVSDLGWVGITKLMDVVATCRDILGPDVAINVVSHSQGTVLTLAALQYGMRVDNWVLMGSPLNRSVIENSSNQTDLDAARANVSGSVVNLWSEDDCVVGHLFPGIGGCLPNLDGELNCGLPASHNNGNICDVGISGIDHYGGEGNIISCTSGSSSWWKMDWLEEDYDGWYSNRCDIFQTELLEILNFSRSSSGFSSSGRNRFQSLRIFARDGDRLYAGGDSANDNAFTYTFTLTQDMVNGLFFNDKDEARYEVTCHKGTVQCRIRAATLDTFDAGTGWTTISAGQTKEVTYEVPGIFDATVWFQIKGISPGTARARCTFTAED